MDAERSGPGPLRREESWRQPDQHRQFGTPSPWPPIVALNVVLSRPHQRGTRELGFACGPWGRQLQKALFFPATKQPSPCR
jgi:hypothetical protein